MSGGLKKEIGSVKAIGSNEVGEVGGESNATKLDEYTNEV